MPAGLIITSNRKTWIRDALRTRDDINGATIINELRTTLKHRMQRLAKQAFVTQGSSTLGGRWAKLSEPYGTRKAKLAPGKTILRKKDSLFKSYVTNRGNVSIGNRRSFGFTFNFGSLDSKAEFHQKGTSKMPARKVMSYTRQQLVGISASIGRTIKQGLFKRKWFDKESTSITLRNTGFDVVDVD